MIATWNDLGREWASLFGATVAQNTAFLLLVLLALWLLRGAPAGLRHRVALIGTIKLLLPPLLPLPAGAGGLAGTLASPGGFAPLVLGGPGPGSGAREAAGAATPGPAALLLLVWAIGAVGLLTVSLLRSWLLARRLAGTRPLPAATLPVALPAGLTVHRSDLVATPLSLGPRPRRIFVPAAWDAWSPACRALALRHELAHIGRRDGLWRIPQLMVRSLYFFHPLVWLLDRELDATREMAVDDAAAGGGRHGAVAYSRHLVDIAESLVGDAGACGAASALYGRRRGLLGRIRYQLEKGEDMSKWTGRAVLASLALLLIAAATSWHPGTAAPDGQPPAVLAGLGGTIAADMPGQDQESAKQKELAEKKAQLKAQEHATQEAEQKAKAKAARKQAGGDAEHLELKVELHKDGLIGFKGKEAISARDFQRKLAGSELAGRDDVVFTIVCADGVRMGSVHRFAEALRSIWDQPKVRFVDAEGRSVPLNLPPAGVEEKLAGIGDENVARIDVAADGTVTLDGRKLPVGKVTGKAEQRLERNPKLVFAVASDADTPYEAFAAVLGGLQKAGAKRIAVVPPKGVEVSRAE